MLPLLYFCASIYCTSVFQDVCTWVSASKDVVCHVRVLRWIHCFLLSKLLSTWSKPGEISWVDMICIWPSWLCKCSPSSVRDSIQFFFKYEVLNCQLCCMDSTWHTDTVVRVQGLLRPPADQCGSSGRSVLHRMCAGLILHWMVCGGWIARSCINIWVFFFPSN